MLCASGSAELAELEACGSNARTQLPSIPTQFFTQTPLDTENSCALLVPASQSGCFLAEGEAVGNLRVRRGDQGHSMLESFIALQSRKRGDAISEVIGTVIVASTSSLRVASTSVSTPLRAHLVECRRSVGEQVEPSELELGPRRAVLQNTHTRSHDVLELSERNVKPRETKDIECGDIRPCKALGARARVRLAIAHVGVQRKCKESAIECEGPHDVELEPKLRDALQHPLAGLQHACHTPTRHCISRRASMLLATCFWIAKFDIPWTAGAGRQRAEAYFWPRGAAGFWPRRSCPRPARHLGPSRPWSRRCIPVRNTSTPTTAWTTAWTAMAA